MTSSIRLRNSGRKCAAHRVHHLPPHALRQRAARGLLGQVLAAQVRGHDHHGVPEVDRAALAVRQPPVVEQLQHDVQHFRVRLLDLVEQHDRIRPPTDGLGELARLIVADVSRRRADQTRDRVLLLVLRHVDSDQRMLVVEQELGERAGHLGLADAGRSEEQEAAKRPVRILQAGARAADRAGHGLDGLVLTDDALVQPLFHLEQLLDLALHQLADRNAGPAADDRGDVFLVDFLLEHAAAGGEARLAVADLLLERRQPAVLQLGRLRIVAGPLRALDLEAQRFELLLQLARLLDRGLLLLPLRSSAGRALPSDRPARARASRAARAMPCRAPCAAPRARSRAASRAARPRRARPASSRFPCAAATPPRR